jgi:hypothetical protein
MSSSPEPDRDLAGQEATVRAGGHAGPAASCRTGRQDLSGNSMLAGNKVVVFDSFSSGEHGISG